MFNSSLGGEFKKKISKIQLLYLLTYFSYFFICLGCLHEFFFLSFICFVSHMSWLVLSNGFENVLVLCLNCFLVQFGIVTPPPLPWRLMGARHCVELGLFNLYLSFSQIKKNIYIYIISTTVVVFMFYTLSPITSQYTKLIPIPKIQRLWKQCGEHLSLSWPALLMWDVLSSILVFYFCTYMD